MLSTDRTSAAHTLVVILPDASGNYAESAFSALRRKDSGTPGCAFLAPEAFQASLIDQDFCEKEAAHIYEQISKKTANKIVILAPSYGCTLADKIVEKFHDAFREKGQQVHVVQLDPFSEVFRSCCKGDPTTTTLADCEACAEDLNDSIQGMADHFGISVPRGVRMPFTPQHFLDVLQGNERAAARVSDAMRNFMRALRLPRGETPFVSYLNRMLSLAVSGQNSLKATDTVSVQRFFSQEMLDLMREHSIAATAKTHLELIGYLNRSFPAPVLTHVTTLLTAPAAPLRTAVPVEAVASADGSGGASGSYVFAAPPEGVGSSMMAISETRSVDG